jgi:hypothetical protein
MPYPDFGLSPWSGAVTDQIYCLDKKFLVLLDCFADAGVASRRPNISILYPSLVNRSWHLG